MYAIGSFEPLSSSSSGRRFCLSPCFLLRRMEKTDADRSRTSWRPAAVPARTVFRSPATEPPATRNRPARTPYDHTDRSQYDARADDGFYLRELRVHTAREEDNTQGDHTHELGHLDRTVRDEIQTEQHAHPEEQQQRGGPETIRDLTGHHRHEEQQRAYQYYVFTTDVYHSSPFMLHYALSTMFSLVRGLYSRSAYSNACMAAKRLSGVR